MPILNLDAFSEQRTYRAFLDNGFGMGEAERLVRVGLISEAMRRTSGNQCKAAKLLKMHRNTLWRAMADLGMPTGREHWGAR